MRIGQFCFFRLSSPSEHLYSSEKYGSRYQGQRGRLRRGRSRTSTGPI